MDTYVCSSCPGTNPTPYCGDGACNNGETCGSCPADCGACSTTPGTITARSVIISPADLTCDAANTSTTYLPDTLNLSPNESPGAQSVGGGSHASWSVPPGTYTIENSGATGYVLSLACWHTSIVSGTSVTGSVDSGDTLTWNLAYTVTGPWFQDDGGGDVYASGTIRTYIPPSASPDSFALTGAGGTPGIITYGTDYDFDSGVGKGEAFVSSTGWLTNETYATTDYYQLFYHRFGSPAPTASGAATLTSQLAGTTMPADPTPYYYDGDLTINGSAWNIPTGQSVVVFVSGNLAIHTPIMVTPGGFLAFIVNGSITIDPSVGVPPSSSVPVLEGVYITSPNGIFDTGASTNAGTERLVGRGTFVAGSFTLERNLVNVGGNNSISAELFLYDPQFLLTMPDKMRDLPITWQEVAPDQSH